jgi:hypothetical protein
VKARPQGRAWDVSANVAFIVASITAVLVAALLIAAFVIDPPALGWIGFGITSAVVVVLAGAATLLLPRMRVSAPRPAVASDSARRLLVVADADCSEALLCDELEARVGGAVAVYLVVPIRVSHLHFLANDEASERRDAEETMLNAVMLLQQRGISATGTVGSDKPLESMLDALAAFPATHVLLAVPPQEESYWLERDLLAKARDLTELDVDQVVVSRKQPARQG